MKIESFGNPGDPRQFPLNRDDRKFDLQKIWKECLGYLSVSTWFAYGGWKQFPVLSKTHILRGHYTHSISVDAKIMSSNNCPIIGEHVAVNFMVR